MAARARSVHLIILSKDQKLGREESGHTHNSIILCPKDTHFQSSVDWPPEAYNPTKTTQLPQGQNSLMAILPHQRAHLNSCVGGPTPPPHNHTHFTPLFPFRCPHNHTTMGCLSPPRCLAGVKGHIGQGHAHLSSRKCLQGHAQPDPEATKPALIHTHAHWGMPPGLGLLVITPRACARGKIIGLLDISRFTSPNES